MTKKNGKGRIDENIIRGKILYIHGFLSGANTKTVECLRTKYDYIFDFIVPELTADIDYSLNIINETIKKEKPRLIIGSSLGGCYALLCDSGDIPVLVINPCVNPYEHFNEQYLDKEFQYHVKRNDGQTTYRVTKDIVDKFKKYDIASAIESKGNKLWAILCYNDEVLGDTHLKLFSKIRSEQKEGNKLFYSLYDFGHRTYPNGVPFIDDFIYAILWE